MLVAPIPHCFERHPSFTSLTAWSEALRQPGVVNQLACALVLMADSNNAAVVELPSQSTLAVLLGSRRGTIAPALRLLQREGGVRLHEGGRCEVSRSQMLARLPAARADTTGKQNGDRTATYR